MAARGRAVVLAAAAAVAACAASTHASLSARSAHAAGAPIPLDAAMGFAVRSQLAAVETTGSAGGATLVAWVETVAGASNVVVATVRGGSGPFGAPVRVTNFSADDGSEVALFGFFSTEVLHFSRRPTGGANPTHRATPDPGGFFAASTKPVLTGDPRDVHVSLVTTLPVEAVVNGVAVWTALARRGSVPAGNIGPFPYDAAQLLAARVSQDGRALENPAEPPQILFESKHGLITGFDFAPDGRSVAIANDRGDHGFVGVLPLGDPNASVTWVSPSVDSDTAPTWSPDGRFLAWRRETTLVESNGRDPRCTRGGYCGTAGPAYSIMVAEVHVPGLATGGGPAVAGPAVELHRDWTHGYPDGSAGYGSRPLVWMRNRSGVVFGCEDDAFMQVCAAHVQTNDKTGGRRRKGVGSRGRASGGGSSNGDSAGASDVPAGSSVVVTGAERCDHQAFALVGDTVLTTNNCDLADSLGIGSVHLATGARSVVQRAEPHLVSGMSHSGAHLLALADGSLVYFQSTHNTSTTVVVRGPDGTVRPLSTPDRDEALSRFVAPKLVTFPSADGGRFTLHAQVFEPPLECPSHEQHGRGSATGGKRASAPAPAPPPLRPGVVFTHGGCQRQMYGAVHYSLPYAQLYALNQHLASLGAVVVSVNYRGGPGYGVVFRAANGSGWQGATEYQDVREAALYLKSRGDVGSVGIYGLSYGGLNAMQGVTRDSKIFSAAVANAPVVNWLEQKRFDESWPGTGTVFDYDSRHRSEWRTLPEGPSAGLAGPRWLDAVRANSQLAFASSPAAYLGGVASPLLMIQGDSDEEVPFQETVGVVRTLRALGIAVETLVFPDETHGLSRFANQVAAANATARFLLEHLGGFTAAAD